MIDWLTGCQVGWTRKMSFSRTLSRILTKMFSFANWKTSALPHSRPEPAGDLPGEVRVRVAVVDLELVRVHGVLPTERSSRRRHASRPGAGPLAARLGVAIVLDAIALRQPGSEGRDRDDAVALGEAHHDHPAGARRVAVDRVRLGPDRPGRRR